MYLNWPLYYIPKFNGTCSFLINPLFVYIILNDKKLHLGNYRYLLLYFSIFNFSCSLCDFLVPMCVHDYRYAFTVFTSDGFFVEESDRNHLILSVRCSFISATYAILHAHFVYRFMVLFNSKILSKYFLPYGLAASVLYCLFHMVYWIIACHIFLRGDKERRSYARDSIMESYGMDTTNLNMVIALYREGSYDAVQNSWIGILSITFLSVDSVIIYFILGFLTVKKLNSQALIMSRKTKRLQKQLMKALIVQSVIPTCVSFAPSILAWYQPVFNVDLGRWIQHGSAIAVSAFPFLDPLAILCFVPTFRRRIGEIIASVTNKSEPATSSSSKAVFSVDGNVFPR